MGLFGGGKAKRMQLFHHDNGDLEFRRLGIVGPAVTEFDDTGKPKNAWIDFFKTLYPFNGYRGIPADAVQLAYGRHFHLELPGQDILSKAEKPPNEDLINSPYITPIAEERAIHLAQAKKPRSVWDKLTIILGIGFILEVILWGLKIYVSRDGNAAATQIVDYALLGIPGIFLSWGKKRQPKKEKDVAVKRVSHIRWWLLIPGAVLCLAGLLAGWAYFSSLNMLLGALCVGGLTPGVFLTWFGLKHGETGYAFTDRKKKYTGKENAIVISARGNSDTNLAEPELIDFVEVKKEELPEGARLHYVRNLKRHFYELQNIVKEGVVEMIDMPLPEGTKPVEQAGQQVKPKVCKLVPVRIPDKKYCPPSKFVIASSMQAYRDYMEFNPSGKFQQIASGVLLVAMGIVGILMVVTGPPAGG